MMVEITFSTQSHARRGAEYKSRQNTEAFVAAHSFKRNIRKPGVKYAQQYKKEMQFASG